VVTLKKATLISLFSFFIVITLFNVVSAGDTFFIVPDSGFYIVAQVQDTFKINTNLTINFFVYNETNGGLIDNSSTNCSVYLADDKGELLVNGDASYTGEEYWNFLILSGNFSRIGSYNLGISCVNGNQGGAFVKYFETTAIGIQYESIFLSPIMLTLLSLFCIFLAFGLYAKIPSLGFIASICLMIAGIYTMIYGLNVVTDLYTRAIAVVMLGVGFIIMFISAYEWFTFD